MSTVAAGYHEGERASHCRAYNEGQFLCSDEQYVALTYCARHRLADAVTRHAGIAIRDAAVRFASCEKANFDVFEPRNLEHFYLIAARDLKVKRCRREIALDNFSSHVTLRYKLFRNYKIWRLLY